MRFVRHHQLRLRVLAARRKVSDVVGVCAVPVGQPSGREFDDSRMMEHDPKEQREMGSHRHTYRSVVSEMRRRWLQSAEHTSPVSWI